MRWIVRAWRWRVEVRPLPLLLGFACWYALGRWLTPGRIDTIQTVLNIVIAVCAVVIVAVVASASRQRRKVRGKTSGERQAS